LLTEHPGLVNRVTQRDLANFLNITDVALSRIAKRVRNEGVTATADVPTISDEATPAAADIQP